MQELGAFRRGRITDGGKLVLEFWQALPAGADPMTWFSGETVRVTIVPESIITEDDDNPLPTAVTPSTN